MGKKRYYAVGGARIDATPWQNCCTIDTVGVANRSVVERMAVDCSVLSPK